MITIEVLIELDILVEEVFFKWRKNSD